MMLVVAAADPKGNISPRNLEFRGGERSHRSVSFNLAAGNAAALGVFNFQFRQERAVSWPLSEGGARELPCSVIAPFEISNRDITGRGCAKRQRRHRQRACKQSPRESTHLLELML